MKIYGSITTLCFALLLSTVSQAQSVSRYNLEKSWPVYQQEVEKLTKSKKYKKLKPKRIKNKKALGKEIKLVKKFRALNKRVVNMNSAGYIRLGDVEGVTDEYDAIETQADAFANAGGNSEGRGACMRECADNFPGTGGGNGVNRVACKIACLVLGE